MEVTIDSIRLYSSKKGLVPLDLIRIEDVHLSKDLELKK